MPRSFCKRLVLGLGRDVCGHWSSDLVGLAGVWTGFGWVRSVCFENLDWIGAMAVELHGAPTLYPVRSDGVYFLAWVAST
jgi:hypothetical protein